MSRGRNIIGRPAVSKHREWSVMGDVDKNSWGKGVDGVLRSAKLFGCCVYFRIGMVVWVMELL
jgi:hypothetical protein